MRHGGNAPPHALVVALVVTFGQLGRDRAHSPPACDSGQADDTDGAEAGVKEPVAALFRFATRPKPLPLRVLSDQGDDLIRLTLRTIRGIPRSEAVMLG